MCRSLVLHKTFHFLSLSFTPFLPSSSLIRPKLQLVKRNTLFVRVLVLTLHSPNISLTPPTTPHAAISVSLAMPASLPWREEEEEEEVGAENRVGISNRSLVTCTAMSCLTMSSNKSQLHGSSAPCLDDLPSLPCRVSLQVGFFSCGTDGSLIVVPYPMLEIRGFQLFWNNLQS